MLRSPIKSSADLHAESDRAGDLCEESNSAADLREELDDTADQQQASHSMSSQDKLIVKLKGKRRSIKTQLTKFSNYLKDKGSDLSPLILETKLERLTTAYIDGLGGLLEQFIEADTANLAAHEAEHDKLEEDYQNALVKAKQLIAKGKAIELAAERSLRREDTSTLSPSPSPSQVFIQQQGHDGIKLPDIPLGSFDGKIEDWAGFKNKFINRIDKNARLSAVDKMSYLQSYLTGKAARAISSLECTEENYAEAWKILTKKYDKSRKIILRHIYMLMNLPKLQKDTPDALDDLVDDVQQHIRALKTLGESVETWDSILIRIIMDKISESTANQWETTLKDNQIPKYTSLLEFLAQRGSCSTSSIDETVRSREQQKGHGQIQRGNGQPQRYNAQSAKGTGHQARGQTFSAKTTSDAPQRGNQTSGSSCIICNQSHKIYACPVFKAMSIEQREREATKHSICYNCLSPGHGVANCKSIGCRVCRKRHHTFLHKPEIPSADTPTDNILPTAIVDILDCQGNAAQCRALIDTGSTVNFITQDLADRLQLPKKKCSVPIGVLNDLTTEAKQWVKATIKSRYNSYQRTLCFLVVPHISLLTPDKQLDRVLINIPANVNLADPEFHKPAPIHMLLATGPSFSILKRGQIRLSAQNDADLFLQDSLLGWLIGGGIQISERTSLARCHLTDLLGEIRRFWEIEDGGFTKTTSIRETDCEEHFRNHVAREQNGRYVVALPFNKQKNEIGRSYCMAKKRLLALEKKLNWNPELKKQYIAVINEYKELGHMKRVQDEQEDGFYLPHHAVIKESSVTTKVRVVFDGSASSSTKTSLNDALMVGPTIQDDIFSLVLRFRLYNYVLTGDIEKMYRQILVRPEDRKYQRILWRDEDNEIHTYELQTVTFGLASAPYLAIRCLHQLAEDEGDQYPLAARVLTRDLYVDDLLTGTDTVEEGIQLRNEILDLLKTGCFNLRQCASNAPDLLQGLPDCSVNLQILGGNDSTLKTLGIRWDSQRDSIVYTVNPIATKNRITMRTVSSDIARIFDPLGLLNPVVVYAKLIKQDLWRFGLHWDDSVPLDIEMRWQQFASQLPALNNMEFERKLVLNQPTRVELHGFCDASEKAYGACIYLRSTDIKGKVMSQLYCAKSRVAPLKTKHTIPRLELCAAALLSQVYHAVKSAISLNIDRTVFWTDSTVTLHWIHTEHKRLQTFVANRVKEIQERTNYGDWRHVRTHDNPADVISRGQLPQEFLCNSFWKQGPTWLTRGEEDWPIIELTFPSQPQEIRKEVCLTIIPHIRVLLEKYSSFKKLQRITALAMRVFPHNHTDSPLISSKELQAATHRIIKWTQQSVYDTEIKLLERGQALQKGSDLAKLSPFIDSNGVIRVGGRLHQADHLSYDQKHPMVLPKSHHVTGLIIAQEHHNCLHPGVQGTLYHVRQKYWPTDGRNQVRKIIRTCTTCARANPPPVDYVMGNLPRERITAARPFLTTGVDYCGPFFIKEKKFRNQKRIKVYVAIFVCLAVKAVHIEIVSDMTTEGFLSALRRFTSRRGRCAAIFSDNGSNFVGANNELKELYEFLQNEEHNRKIHDDLATKGISWHFMPPQSPNFGGLWEAAVKSFKHHLKRVVGVELLTFENFNSLVIEIEAILNSRPLTPLSSDPNDLLALTPAHFLIGESLTSLPTQDFSTTPSNRLSPWQHIQKIKQDFWVRWHKEYLNQLNIRHKWSKGTHDIKEGSIVLLREDHLPPLQWRLGRVTKTYPGQDDIVRTVDVKTAHGVFKRNVKKLAPLPVDNRLIVQNS